MVGGSATYFSLAASFFTDVRLVAVVGEDFADRGAEVFDGRSIDLAGLQTVPGETFRWKGEYGFDLNQRETIYTKLNVFEQFQPVIPEAYRSSPFVFLGNIHPRLQLGGAGSGDGAPPGGGRHDELLDRGHAGRAARGAQARRHPDHQRLRGAGAVARGQPGEGRPGPPGDGPVARWSSSAASTAC